MYFVSCRGWCARFPHTADQEKESHLSETWATHYYYPVTIPKLPNRITTSLVINPILTIPATQTRFQAACLSLAIRRTLCVFLLWRLYYVNVIGTLNGLRNFRWPCYIELCPFWFGKFLYSRDSYHHSWHFHTLICFYYALSLLHISRFTLITASIFRRVFRVI
jgi:hypothetical protein